MNNEALYQERFARIKKAIALEPVDQVPVVYMGVAFAPRYMGMSMAKFCADPEASLQVNLAAMDRLNGFGGLDGCNLAGGGRIAPQLTTIWLSHIAEPGKELPDDSLWQVQEKEVMTHDDYDAILKDGWGKFMMGYFPRVADPSNLFPALEWMGANAMRVAQLYREHGYVTVCDAPVMFTIPFEYLCGGRSMTKFYFDLFRTPDKVEAVMQVLLEDFLAQIAAAPSIPGIIGATWLGGWRAASALVSPKLWDRFVWPYYLKIAEAIIAKGYTPVFHWDQDWSRDLVRLQEMPAKKCILNPDGMTDMHKFKALVGDRMAMMGDIPSSLLAAGTPDDVYKFVRDEVELFEGKGLILCPGCDAPINARPENMEAFVAAAHEFGKVPA
ncbi:MAG: uroporphyrinogen decarboxylase family protein [Negativicutes bacterium]|nr:uroporphyrinogen decarboxylase family protein [Negativicutes bacterium]